MIFLNRSPFHILLVDDNDSEAKLAKLAIAEKNTECVINEVRDGEQALQYLRKQNPFSHAVRPDLILLDINLPKISGIEVLTEIKKDEELKLIPVVVLSASGYEEHILEAYKLHANCYVVKPLDFNELAEALYSIVHYWNTIVRLPVSDNAYKIAKNVKRREEESNDVEREN